MPNYPYICKSCNKTWEDIVPVEEMYSVKCPICGEIAQVNFANWGFQFIEKNKWRETGKNRPDQGIPFGEVPGDEQYANTDFDDPDYMGPLP